MGRKVLLLLALWGILGLQTKAQVVINEIQAANDGTIPDEDGDYPDWLELYNAGGNTVNLVNLHLSDDPADLYKWTFPDVFLEPQHYLLVFASDKNRLGAPFLHTNFKISSSGEMLLLTDADGIVLDAVNAPPLLSNQSYGKLPDGVDGGWVILNNATPGYTNSQGGVFTTLEFSHERGFYANDFNLQLTTPNADNRIFYTTNGKEPSVNGLLYEMPIAISDPTGEPYLYSNIKTTELTGDYRWAEPTSHLPQCQVIRAAVFDENDNLVSNIATHSYFVGKGVQTRFPYPIVSMATKPEDLFSNETGIYVPGVFFDPDADNWEWTGNFFQKGNAWERPVHLSMFLPAGELQFAQDAGVRIHGQRSRAAPQKTFRVYARGAYGAPDLEYPLFETVENETYKRFLIRTPLTDWSRALFKDAACHELLRNFSDLELMASRTILLFVNGEYWGIHNLRERQDERYIAYHYSLPEEEVLLFEPWGTPIDHNDQSFADYRQFVLNNDLSLPENYEYIRQHADIDNFIDYQIAHIYFQNRDWPGNNEKIWKPDTVNAKFRWLFFDVDAGMYDAEANSLEWATDEEKGWSTAPLRKLLQNIDFKQKFVERFVWHLNNTFEPERFISIIEQYEQLYAPEMERYIDRWGDPSSKADWRNKVDGLKEFARLRPCYMKEHLISHFNLPEESVEVTACKLAVEGEGFVYPNPTSGGFWVALGEDFPTDLSSAELAIFSPDGRKIYQADINISISGGTSEFINLSQLTAGLYITELRAANYSLKQKMVVK